MSELILQCQRTSTTSVFPNSHLQSGERMSDGAFSPRDHKHGSGEEHDNSFDHEAILGSRKDAEEYDDLPPEEAKRRLRVSLGCSEFSLLLLSPRCCLGKWTVTWMSRLIEKNSMLGFSDPSSNLS